MSTQLTTEMGDAILKKKIHLYYITMPLSMLIIAFVVIVVVVVGVVLVVVASVVVVTCGFRA